ncbi:MAG: hypothetical protein AB2740_15525 [Candidatus Thiodiazotropha sp.]
MQPRYLLILAAYLLPGCQDNGGEGTPAESTFVARFELSSVSANRDLAPYPNDLWLRDPGSGDSTLSVPVSDGELPPPIEGNLVFLNTLNGFSTTASIRIPFSGVVDAESLVAADPSAPSPSANLLVLDGSSDTLLIPGVAYDIEIGSGDHPDASLVNIVPLRPLRQNTTYMFYLLSGIKSTDGLAITADDQFQQLIDAWSMQRSTGDPNLDRVLSDSVAAVLDKGSELLSLHPESIVAAWSVSTQSISDVIEAVARSAQPLSSHLLHSGLTTRDYDETLSGIADIYTGTVETAYYQSRFDPYQSVWLTAQGTYPDRMNPDPVPTETLTIPLLATLPNRDSGHTQPVDGWPVVIFVDGLGGNRTRATLLADRMAAEGFAILSIDQPLHGVTDPANPFYQGPGNPSSLNRFGANERHFYLDQFNNATGIAGADGLIDNGIQLPGQLINNPLNGRDTLRQSSADLIQLVTTIPAMDLDGDGLPDLDAARIHYAGLSWGAIQGPLLLGINDSITTATLISPGGSWSDLLTDPESLTFGRPLLDQLARQGVVFGTADFDQWLRDWQTILDPVDDLNFAQATTASHPLHVIELLGDIVIPNGATERLSLLLDAEPISATRLAAPGETLTGIVRLTEGNHASTVLPTINPAVTAEIHNQVAIFAASGGTRIEIDPVCDCVQ